MTFTGKPISDVILILWAFSAAFDYLDFIYLWQLKEYRLDLFREFLRSKQGTGFLRGWRVLWRALFAMAVFTFLRDSFRYDTYTGLHIITLIILCVDLLYNAHLYRQKKLRRPVVTGKACLILLTAIGVEAIIILLTKQMNILLLLLVFRFSIASGVVLAFRYPTMMMKFWYVGRATKKLKTYPHLQVIGITGSYGKSSVKTFLTHILRARYCVVSTPKNINTEIGVAKFILSTDFSSVDIFVCEMGAYKVGEIKLIAEMVQPNIGIITAINEQHLAIFGSIENTRDTKFELVRALPQTGLAVLNVDNPYIREGEINIENTRIETYGLDEEYDPDCRIVDVSYADRALNLVYQYRGKTHTLTAEHLSGEHHAHNLAACLIVAAYLGLNDQEIGARVRSVESPPGTLRIFKVGKATIIDDSYNSNPDGFKAALYVLAESKSDKRRIVVTRGMQELGDRSEYLHERIGGEIAYTADELVITKPDHADALKSGVGVKYRTIIREIYDFDRLESYLLDRLDEDCIILLENRLPPHIYRSILNQSTHERTNNT